jgi:cyanophycinase
MLQAMLSPRVFSVRVFNRAAVAFALIAYLPRVQAETAAPKTSYQYSRLGHPQNVKVSPHPGYALMGGGTDLDEAFLWLCGHAAGGDLLVLRATGTDAYNPYILKLCRLNSVATLVIPDRTAANDPFVAKAIREASALFISGGDQANYINSWKDTPVEAELNNAIRRGVPMGGTSAGLAVLGEYAYTAQGDQPDDANLDSPTALADPFSRRITLSHNFLTIPILKAIITDTHFARRNRMGRLLAFMARIKTQDAGSGATPEQAIRGIGVEQGAAVLLDPDGRATIVGVGAAYFVNAQDATGVCEAGKPLTFGPFTVQKVSAGHSFELKGWTGDSLRYQLSVNAGTIGSTQAGGAIY